MQPDNRLTTEEKQRYARHLLLPEVGEAGQQKLKAAKVLIIGMGGLGSPVALYLAAAGIGTLGLCDGDQIDASNLQRQILYTASDVGHSKIETAKAKLEALNPNTIIKLHAEKFSADHALDLIKDYDLVIDGTDNFAAHYLINDACVIADKPLIYGNVHRFEGMLGTVLPKQGPCYRCLYPAPPPPDLVPSCAEAGVLGIVPGMVGMMQAMEAVKLILGLGSPLTDRILHIDSLSSTFKPIRLARDTHCTVCGDSPSITQLSAPELSCATVPEIAAEELKRVMKSKTPLFLLDVRQPQEYDAGSIEGATLIPLHDLPGRLGELNPQWNIVAYCHSGMRSAIAARLLLEKGFAVRSLKGGIVEYRAA